MREDSFINKEDYEEPCCPLKMKTDVTPINTGRVLEKLDEYLGRNDYAAAERHLKYWLQEAEEGNDDKGRMTVLNEQIGLYRKINKKEEGYKAIEAALALNSHFDAENSVTVGTTLLNGATGYNAFGDHDKADALYKEAQKIYEAILDDHDSRLAGLYNNMAINLVELKDYDSANIYYDKALRILSNIEGSELEIAITYLNICDLISWRDGNEAGEERIGELINKAFYLINKDGVKRDGYYAFVCEKCAPTIRYYGYFMMANELEKRAKDIYDRA